MKYCIAFSVALLSTTSCWAQDAVNSAPQYQFDLGIGVGLSPRYETADSYVLSPFPIVSVGRFYLPGIGQLGDGDKAKTGIYFYPSLNFIGSRDAKDNAHLKGTRHINWALEVGAGVGYEAENWRVFANARQGFNGHRGQVGELGADAILRPTDRLDLSIGPRLSLASGKYMKTYFGITSAEARASGGRLSAYNPKGGIKSVGAAAEANYQLTDSVKLKLKGRYDRLVDDAAKSPLARTGSRNQFSAGLGLSYRFGFDLFD